MPPMTLPRVTSIEYARGDGGSAHLILRLSDGRFLDAAMDCQKLLHYGHNVAMFMPWSVIEEEVFTLPDGRTILAATSTDPAIVAMVKDAWELWRAQRWEVKTIPADRYYDAKSTTPESDSSP